MKWQITVMLALALMACEDKGPMEQAGEELDEAVQDLRAGGETTGNKIDDAIDKTRDGLKDAKEGVEEAVEEIKPD